jgi:hypothetical protein
MMAFSIGFAMAMVARTTGARLSKAAAVGLGSLALPPAFAELKLGGANALMLLAVAVAWHQIHKGRHVWSGIALGLASATKLYALFLMIPLLRSNNRKAVLAQVATAAISTVGAGVIVGARETLHLVTRVMPVNTKNWLTSPHNLSILAIQEERTHSGQESGSNARDATRLEQ